MRLRAEISSFGEFNRLQELEQKLSDCLLPRMKTFLMLNLAKPYFQRSST